MINEFRVSEKASEVFANSSRFYEDEWITMLDSLFTAN